MTGVSKLATSIGAASLFALSASPAWATTIVSQSTAQAIAASAGGQNTATPTMTATNDGHTQTVANADTSPAIPTSTPTVSDIAPQLARANTDGTSQACAGLTGPGSAGITELSGAGCTIQGEAFHINLADLDLTQTLLGGSDPLAGALSGLPGLSTLPIGLSADSITAALSKALAATPLGSLQIRANLGSISAHCAATPARATGGAQILDANNSTTQPAAFAVTIPTATGGTQTLPIVTLPSNPAANTHVVTNFNTVSAALTDAVKAELNAAVGSELATLGIPSTLPLFDAIQGSVVNTLAANLGPVTQQLQQNLIDITLNKQTVSDAGRKIDVSALDGLLIPLTASATTSSAVTLTIGHVTCGANSRLPASSAIPTPLQDQPVYPAAIESGEAAHHTSPSPAETLSVVSTALSATALLGIAAYRRWWMPRG